MALKPFEKGRSGNPNGRPKGTPNTRTIIEKFLNTEIEHTNPLTSQRERLTVAEFLHLSQLAKAIILGDTTAYKAVMDRYEGTPQAHTEATDGEPIKRIVIVAPTLQPDN
jgi:hypothetical protein